MKTEGETGHSDQLLKPRRPKSREVSSRFLCPASLSSSPSEIGFPSPNQTISPLKQKPRSSTDSRKQRSLDDGGLVRGLWPSSSNQNLGTLADHLGNNRLKDLIAEEKHNEKSMFVNRQRSCTEFSRFEKTEEESRKISKENHKPFFGGSMRYTGKLRFPRRSSSKTSSDQSPSSNDEIVPGRFSVDENALRRKSLARSDSLSESESECSGTSFGSSLTGKNSSAVAAASYMNSTASSRKSGVEVSSKFLHDLRTKTRRGTLDSNIPNPASFDSSSPKKLVAKSAMKRANSLTLHGGGAVSKWALSPGRAASPPMTVENRGKPPPPSFSNLKPPTSPSRVKGVGNLLSMGLDLFRSKKSAVTTGGSGLGPTAAVGESVHQLRLAHNRLVQWRFANARGGAVDGHITNQAESNLIHASNSLTKLQHSVAQKKLQLEKEKLEMKLNFVLHSQIKSLEAWGDLERQHVSAVSSTKDCLHSVTCRVPLVEGAKMEPHSASIALRHASDLATSIKSMLYSFSPMADKTVSMLSELAEVVTQEKALLDEFLELFRIISTLEVQERSLKCSVIQMRLGQQQQQLQHPQEEMAL